MVAALAWVGETLVVPEGTRISMMTREAFDNMLLKEAGRMIMIITGWLVGRFYD